MLIGARWFGFLGSPHERDCYLGVPLESQITNPKPPHLPLVEVTFTNQKLSSLCTWGFSWCQKINTPETPGGQRFDSHSPTSWNFNSKWPSSSPVSQTPVVVHVLSVASLTARCRWVEGIRWGRKIRKIRFSGQVVSRFQKRQHLSSDQSKPPVAWGI